MAYFDTNEEVICADINNKCNVLALCLRKGAIQFYSIASFEHIFLFKEFQLTKGTPLNQALFSTSSEEIAVLSKAEHRVYYLITNLSLQF